MPRLCGGLGGVAWASLPLLDFTLAWQARCRTLGEGITEPQSRSVHSTLRQNTTTLSTAPHDNDAEERKMLQESKQGERTVFTMCRWR